MESLHKLNKNSFDIVILDECESVLKQFNSDTMKKKELDVYNVLLGQLSFCDKAIFADAFFTNRSMNFIKSFDEKVTFIKNNTSPDKRDAVEIEKFNDTVLKSCENGDNNFVVYNSKTELKLLENSFNTFKQYAPGCNNKTALFYHADKSDAMDIGLQNINNTWLQNNLIGISPKITVGCSFTEKHFHNVFVNGTASSCCVRDTFQSIMRARHLINNKLYFSISKLKVSKVKKTKEMEMTEIIEKANKINVLTKKILKNSKTDKDKCELNLNHIKNVSKTPQALKDIMLFNQYEDIISENHYEEMFYEFLYRCGYTVTKLEDAKRDKKKETIEPHVHLANYLKIGDITSDEVICIQKNIKGGLATEKEKQECNKYFFKLLIKAKNNEKTAILYYEYYNNRFGKQFLLNAANEINSNVADVMTKMLNKTQIEESRGTDALRFHYVKKILKILDLKHSQEYVIIDKTLLNDKLYPYLSKNMKDIRTAFNLQGKDIPFDMNDKKCISSCYQTTNNIFKAWNGFQLKANKIDAHTKTAINYKLQGVKFLDCIQKKAKIDMSLFDHK